MKLSKFEAKNHVYKDAKRDKSKDFKKAQKQNKKASKAFYYNLAQQG